MNNSLTVDKLLSLMGPEYIIQWAESLPKETIFYFCESPPIDIFSDEIIWWQILAIYEQRLLGVITKKNNNMIELERFDKKNA